MKLLTQDSPRLPVEDYSFALRNAISWLGPRYVLAVPVKGRAPTEGRIPFFGAPLSWHQSVHQGR